MKSFRLAIERFCIKHPRFGVPRLMLYIIVPSAAVYALMFILQEGPAGIVYSYLLFVPEMILKGQVWRLVSWIFIPSNPFSATGLIFTALFLYFYYFIGNTLENAWGEGKFTIFYISGVLLHVIFGFIVHLIYGGISLAFMLGFTAGYLNLSMFFAFALLNPDFVIRLFLIIPIKMKWAALANAVIFAFGIARNLVAGNYMMAIFPIIALLNFFVFCGDELWYYLRTNTKLFANFGKKSNSNVINFKKEAKKARRDVENKPYRHICAVCGKTDTEYPNLEFRYCSLCEGFHCFCSEHIDNHIHFEE